MAERTKIPVWTIAADTARLMAKNWRAAIMLSLVPVSLWIGGGILDDYIAEAVEGDVVGQWVVFAFETALGVATVPILIVPWFRLLLSPADRTGGGFAPYLRCTVWLALFYLLLTAVSLTFAAMSRLAPPVHEVQLSIGVFVPILEALIGFYIFARFGLVLPSLAAGDRISVLRAWQISRGNGLRVAIVCVVPLFFVAFFGGVAVSEIRAAFPPGHDVLGASVTLTLAAMMVAAELLFWATVLIVFRKFIDAPRASP